MFKIPYNICIIFRWIFKTHPTAAPQSQYLSAHTGAETNALGAEAFAHAPAFDKKYKISLGIIRDNTCRVSRLFRIFLSANAQYAGIALSWKWLIDDNLNFF